jgi:hypothetical protein
MACQRLECEATVQVQPLHGTVLDWCKSSMSTSSVMRLTH